MSSKRSGTFVRLGRCAPRAKMAAHYKLRSNPSLLDLLWLCLAILTNNEECHFSRSTACLGHVYVWYDYVHLDNLSDISACLQDVSLWMKNSKLKLKCLNGDQTEFLIIHTSTHRAKLNVTMTMTMAFSRLISWVSSISNNIYRKHAVAVFTITSISVIFAVFAGLYHFPLLNHRNSSGNEQTWLLQFPPLQ